MTEQLNWLKVNGTNAPSPERGSLVLDIENEDKLVCYEKNMYKLINSYIKQRMQ